MPTDLPVRPELARLVETLDPEGIESGRDIVTQADLGPLVGLYQSQTSWKHRCAIIDLVQDHSDPVLKPIMEHVLRCPHKGDWAELPQAVALGYLSPTENHFTTYLNDREALRRDVDAALARLGQRRDPAPAPAPTQAPRALPKDPEEALWQAAIQGRDDELLELLAAGVSPDVKRDGDPVLCKALMEGRSGAAMLLIQAGADPQSRRTIGQQPALWWAAGSGDVAVVKALLERGAEVDAMDQWKTTPLFQASSKGRPDVVRLLLGAGADAARRSYDGRGPLHISVRGGKPEILGMLLDAGVDIEERSGSFTPLAGACFEGTPAMVALLCERGANVEARTRYMGYHNVTPMMFAAQAGQLKMIEVLLRHGADPQARDDDGKTASDWAGSARAAKVRALLAAGR